MTKKFAITVHLTRGQIAMFRGMVSRLLAESKDPSTKRICDILLAAFVSGTEVPEDTR